jgi:hypothetical protein
MEDDNLNMKCAGDECESIKHIGRGKYICNHNNLAVNYPHLVIEWHPDNEPMENFTAGSNKKVLWKCPKNPCGCHIFEASIKIKTLKSTTVGCPFCSRHRLCEHTSLLAMHPEICEEWDYEKIRLRRIKFFLVLLERFGGNVK